MSQQQYIYGKHGFPVSGAGNGGGYSQYSPNGDNSQLNTSPTFGQLYSISKLNNTMVEPPHPYQNGHEYLSSNSSPTDLHLMMPSLGGSTASSVSSGSPEYSFYIPRLRYFLSKSFEMEDDLEFCPAIPENFNQSLYSSGQQSPQPKKFNAYTATVFSPTSSTKETIVTAPTAVTSASAVSPRVHTPRIRKPIEIINPQTRLRISSPALSTK